MKKILLIAVISLLGCLQSKAGLYDAENPVANPEATVVCGNARFTVLTPQLIRMEWSEDGKFEDRKSLAIVNRNLPLPVFRKSVSKSGVNIKTDALTLNYKNDGKPFDSNNLSIELKLNGKKVKWQPGMKDSLNLKGTVRTLDGAHGYKLGKNQTMESGLVSRSGWAVIDDSNNNTMSPSDSHWEEWVDVRMPGNRQDLYFLGYGHDYKQALSDYQKIAGKAVLPPKYAFGYWWSRYWQYSDDELVDLANKFRSFDIPMDVMIVDMDWHDTFGLKSGKTPVDEYGQRVGWTGYTWQKELFPAPANFLKWCANQNLKTSLNLHPASGIQPYEQCYEAFTKDYDWDQPGKSVPFHIDEEKWADSYFKTVLNPMEQQGVNFWWLDWQQWLESKYTPGLSNTFWLNHVFSHHMKELKNEKNQNLRSIIHHRWGGLGSHRYPVGFSGDTHICWETLAFLPWFTSTASNVNYGYWGHDIGGHMFDKNDPATGTDPELYTRWLQYGVFTPIFKTHSTKDRRIVRYPWAFPDHQFAMRDAIQLRYALAPYIYNSARENYDTGIAMCRPMYYEYPETEMAYNSPEQYFFGNDIIATAVCAPVDSITALAPKTVWMPDGEWYDFATGQMLAGNNSYDLSYTIQENPFYVKAGSIIPMNPSKVKSLQVPCDTLTLTFIPGAVGEMSLYEDDGDTDDYRNTYATTKVSRELVDGKLRVKIDARQGGFEGATDKRAYELRFPAAMPPAKVTVAGKEYNYSRFPKAGDWTYDGLTLQPIIYTEMLPVAEDVEIVLDYGEGQPYNEKLFGKQGIFRRCRELTPQFKEEAFMNGEGKQMLPEGYLKVSQCANFITEDPQNINKYIADFEDSLAALPALINDYKFAGTPFKIRMKEQLTK